MADAREVAVRALMAVDRGAWSDLTLSAGIRRAGLDARDAALCTAICSGVLQNRMLLDYQIAAYSALRMNKISPFVINVLRVAACQICLMDRIPDSAAVNTAVAMVRRSSNPKAAGFVNAVLRRICEQGENLRLPDPADPLNRLSVKYSHPVWLTARFLEDLGEEAEAALAADNAAPPVTARINTLRASREEVLRVLAEDGAEAESHAFLTDALILRHSGSIEALRAFRDGLIAIQDAASQLDVLALDPRPGERVLDVCAAPGGKSFAMAARMEGQGRILACDLYPQRLELIRKDARRLGIDMIDTLCRDSADPATAPEGLFDRILVDAPCSGTGVIRKKPEIRYKDEASLRELPPLQSAILNTAARSLKTGGSMVYSTCSILREENEDVVRRFLTDHEEFEAVPFSLPGGITADGGMVTLRPHRNGTDGFFISKLTKRKEHGESARPDGK